MGIDDQVPPKDRLWQAVTMKWFFAVYGIALGYAIIRYHVAGDVEWRHLPLFILNKATSLAAVMFVAASYLIGKVIKWHDQSAHLRLVVIKFCGLMGFFLAAIHAFLSLALLRPSYFGKYFDDGGRLNLQGEFAITLGVIGLFFLMSPAITTLPLMAKSLGGWRWKRSQRAGYLALFLVLLHLIVLGWKGWLAPSNWPAGLVPISLIAAVVALVPLVVKRRLVFGQERKRRGKVAEDQPDL